MAKLKITGSDEQYSLSLEFTQRFTSSGNVQGSPVDGIKPGDRGLLPEKYHESAAGAVYAVFHYETPILWQDKNGQWYAPDHSYSGTTTTIRNKMCRALLLRQIKVTLI